MKLKTVFLLLLPFYVKAQTPFADSGNNPAYQLNEQSIYIFCKGTVSKAGIVAQRYNISDSNITHIGIGYFEKGTCFIFNVFDNPQPTNALRIDDIRSFTSPSEVRYFSIWKLKDFRGVKKLKEILKQSLSGKIIFDWQFNVENGNSVLYCSEFCALMLDRAGIKFAPLTVAFHNQLFESILDRKVLTYYPVDFFQQNKKFIKVYEQYLQ